MSSLDYGGTQFVPNENGWYNDAILKAKITVTSDLTISAIRFKEGALAEEALGSSSPATSTAIGTETNILLLAVLVEFTNGLDTGWIYKVINYDKTAADDPTIDDLDIKNFGVWVVLNAGYNYGSATPAGFQQFEYHYDLDNSAPSAGAAGDTDVMGAATDLEFGLPSPKGAAAAEYGATFYFWVRSRDVAGNVGTWVNASVLLDLMEITGAAEVKDIMELA